MLAYGSLALPFVRDVMRRREFIAGLGGASCVANDGVGAAARASTAHRRAHQDLGRTIRRDMPAMRLFARACSNQVGSKAATCGSIIAGLQAIRSAVASTHGS